MTKFKDIVLCADQLDRQITEEPAFIAEMEEGETAAVMNGKGLRLFTGKRYMVTFFEMVTMEYNFEEGSTSASQFSDEFLLETLEDGLLDNLVRAVVKSPDQFVAIKGTLDNSAEVTGVGYLHWNDGDIVRYFLHAPHVERTSTSCQAFCVVGVAIPDISKVSIIVV